MGAPSLCVSFRSAPQSPEHDGEEDSEPAGQIDVREKKDALHHSQPGYRSWATFCPSPQISVGFSVGASILKKKKKQKKKTQKNPPANEGEEKQVCSLGQEDPLEDGMATHSSSRILEFQYSGTGAWQPTVHGVRRVGYDWSEVACMQISVGSIF